VQLVAKEMAFRPIRALTTIIVVNAETNAIGQPFMEPVSTGCVEAVEKESIAALAKKWNPGSRVVPDAQVI
jgi:hypothetical protein